MFKEKNVVTMQFKGAMTKWPIQKHIEEHKTHRTTRRKRDVE